MYFLLKTLLFLLCIYIKRVAATSVYHSNPRQLPEVEETIMEFEDKRTFEDEFSVALMCPIEELMEIRENSTHLQDTLELITLKNTTMQNVQVHWTKDDKPIHRPNGNPIWGPADTNDLLIFKVSLTDEGTYTCRVNYSRVPPTVSMYYQLYRGAKYLLIVDAKDVLPDTKPTVSREPKDLIVKRGESATFVCKTGITMSTQFRYWYKSCDVLSQSKRPDCMTKFMNSINEATNEIDTHVARAKLNEYLVDGQNSDTLEIHNASDKDVATYACLINNARGHDIRYGSLNFIDRFLQSVIGNVSLDQIIPTTTTTTTKTTTTTSETPTTNRPNSIQSFAEINEVKVAESRQQMPGSILLTGFLIIMLLFLCAMVSAVYCIVKSFSSKKEQKLNQNNMAPLVGNTDSDDIRQHLPSVKCPDIFTISRNDGFISGDGHRMTQSTCDDLIEKEKNPSISSTHSDEASSWGKSCSSHSDNCKAFYLHTSNTTATTVPMYDHPPSNHLLCSAVVRNACVSNPLYGYLQPDPDAGKWAFPRRNLERLNKIGEGQFGEVWKYIARQKDGTEDIVAVKQLKNRAGLGDRDRLELIAEIEIMKSVSNHPNVIKLLNCCADIYEPILLIMEYAEHGKLQTYLRDCRSVNKYSLYGVCKPGPSTSSRELIKFSYHIAKGMEYIASQGIIHRDLASRNVLVSKDKVCKVADFGFARRLSDDCAYERTTTNPVPVKWMAPEALMMNKFTSKSDVYSLGILMWEIVTLGATPYEYLTSTEVYRKVTTGGRLDRPAHCKDEFFDIMSSCWQQDPAQRPTFKELAFRLEKLLLSETDYIQLDQYPEHAYYNILNIEEKEVVRLTPPP